MSCLHSIDPISYAWTSTINSSNQRSVDLAGSIASKWYTHNMHDKYEMKS